MLELGGGALRCTRNKKTLSGTSTATTLFIWCFILNPLLIFFSVAVLF